MVLTAVVVVVAVVAVVCASVIVVATASSSGGVYIGRSEHPHADRVSESERKQFATVRSKGS